ncbi:zf-TFIIB domain-containing protein [Paenibacillus albicereus]|uniref:Zf-TFIIB domain-containing protein n=1 Tax=Paenibacillus albicereus TaxID=2726185 RepID=A0A6H2GW93_9BACL|nr:zf-TFIIB domain-containing protein [Paenibacillus albicereus]QJC51629.1 zf-TFIIB domain-containing protein [Paenibacillus albicereus]
MFCPNDHMVMNGAEVDGVTIFRCPVCGNVRLAGPDGERLAYGGVEVTPYYSGPVEEKQVNATPYGVHEQLEAAAGARDSDIPLYGAPDDEESGFALAGGPYGYVPGDGERSEAPSPPYGMPPAT